MSVFRGQYQIRSVLRSRDVQNIRRYLMHTMNNDLITPQNNSSIISLANSTALKYISYAHKTHDEINLFHQSLYRG